MKMAGKHGKKKAINVTMYHMIQRISRFNLWPPPINIFITYTDMRHYGVEEPDVEWNALKLVSLI